MKENLRYSPEDEPRKIFVDIDETICFYSGKRSYDLAEPNYDNIAKINKLYDEGNIITYWTARGTLTGINWYELTLTQLKHWGCKYHELRMGKPAYDLFIDDKAIRTEDYFNE